MARTDTTADRLSEQVLASIHLPVLIVDGGRAVKWMNEAAASFSGKSMDEAGGRFFGEVLGLDAAASDMIFPADGMMADGLEWHDVVVGVDAGTPRALKVRRKQVKDQDGVSAHLLTVEGAAWWEDSAHQVMAGSQFILFEASHDGTVLRGAEAISDALALEERVATLGNLIHNADPEFQHEFAALWRRVLKGEEMRDVHCDLIDGHNDRHPFSLSLFPVFNIQGEITGVRGAACDLKLQRGLAYALEASEERFSAVFRDSSDPILILSARGEILSANDTFEELTGLRSEEMFRGQKGWKDFVAKEDVSRLRKSLADAARAKTVGTCEYRLLKKDGQPVWFEQRHSILHDEQGRAHGFLAVTRNIDARKQLEFELRNEARVMKENSAHAQTLISRLKSFFTRTSDLPADIDGFLSGICDILFEMYDPFLVYVYMQDSEQVVWRAMDGVTLGKDPAGKVAGIPSAMCVDMLEAGSPFLTGSLLDSEEYGADPLVAKHHLSTYVGAPLRDSTGAIRGTLAVLDQETRPVDSLDVELITVASLQVASRLRAEEQEDARRELEDHLRQAQKMEALGMLAGGVAHDFNNILSGILGFSSYLMNKVEPGTDLHRDIGLIETSAERASDLTRQLLAFARRKHFPKEPVSMNVVVEETLLILKRTLTKNIEIRTQLVKELPNVLGDSGQLGQVVMNLCLNAADAMAARGGLLNVHSEVPSPNERDMRILRNRKDAAKEYVRIVISDTGVGMTEDVKTHIFDPFFTTKTTKGGTGLGLSIVYGIVTNHGGDIMVESRLGAGAAFHVYLPIFLGTVEEKAGLKPEQLTGDETIFVVDDEMIVRQMVTAVLKSHGYRVLTAASGEEAIEMVDKLVGQLDIVLLDMVMPGLNGEETFSQLRERDPALPVLLTSGYVQEEITDRLMKKGAIGLVYKPYKSDVLLSHLREALDAVKKNRG
jgi:PAS domain S-box-containing protein